MSKLAKIKLLIVEDDPMVVDISKEFIKEAPDFQVIGTAKNGTEAVEQTRELEPDIILLDNCLPDFNGIKVIEKIRAFNKKVDFIMVTAVKDVPVVQECFRLGIRDYLIKPFLKQRLLQALHNYKCFRDTLNQPEISQSDLDRLSASTGNNDDYPQKGFSQITEKKIIEILKEKKQGVTSDDIAAEVGVSTVSARRYLKLLQDKNMVGYDLIYGKQGRPTYIYYMIKDN
ncbi:MAG: response regulator [Firmicutes bacterium]|nr:response regulator [Bacillota bacterium]